jgi:hypothetical protein
MEVIDEQVDTVCRSFMALTMGCARCHDHKFDPIPTRDYYAMAGIFQNTKSLVDGNVSSYVTQSLATDAQLAAQKDYQNKIASLTEELEQAKTKVASLGGDLKSTKKNSKQRIVAANSLPGIVVDNTQAKLTGTWTESQSVKQYVSAGYLHDDKQPKGKNVAEFSPQFATGGRYEVRLAYSPGGNRASNVPVAIHHQDGIENKIINQSLDPKIDNLFVSLGTYRFEANNVASVIVSNENTDGVVIVDAVQFLPEQEADASDEGDPDSERNTPNQENPSNENESRTESTQLQDARDNYSAIEKRLKELKKNRPPPASVAMSVDEVESPQDCHIRIRGSVRNLGEVVQRGFIEVVTDKSAPNIPIDSSGRLQLANWIADVDHPLTSRVYVNRVWRHLFGRGLVETADNFGSMGQKPSHPELLDFLARRFADEGWSTKKLIREIMLSRTFRLSTNEDPENSNLDPENRLLWRASRRRVDAEVLRDSILAVSGELDLKMGGRTIRKIETYDLNYTFNTSRRSVYVPAFRNSMLELFEVFDIANPNLVTGHRNTSTLPTQALFLMNSPWVMEQSDAAARRLLDDASDDAEQEALMRMAYLRTLSREPSDEELRISLGFLEQLDQPKEKAWGRIFHALFASLDFRYVN